MLILATSEAIRHAVVSYNVTVPIQILERYAVMFDTEPIAWLFIVQKGDPAGLLAQLRGQPFETWEYIDCTDGWFEAVFITSDEGFGHVVLLRDQPDSDSELLQTCRAFATIGE